MMTLTTALNSFYRHLKKRKVKEDVPHTAARATAATPTPAARGKEGNPEVLHKERSGRGLLRELVSFTPRHYLVVLFIVTLFFATLSNLALWRHVYHIVANSEQLSPWFVLSAPLTVFLLLYAIFILLFSWRYVLKPACVMLFLSCAPATYTALNYGIIFDGNMLTNIMETHPAEALSYLSPSLAGTFLILGVLPSLLLLRVRIRYPRFVISQLQRAGVLSVVLITAGTLVFGFYQQYSYLGRNNKNLNKEILPVSYLYSMGYFIKQRYFEKEQPYVSLGDDARIASTGHRPKLVFLVLGETARAGNFSALGYHRPTNQYTDLEKVFTFADVTSCGTATSYSVPCMFSNLRRENYAPELAVNREGLLDVLKRAGISVTWLDNDAGCKGVCDRVRSMQISPTDSAQCDGSTCRDEIFLNYARDLSKNVTRDSLIAFHLIGSHGPRYYERYPDTFRKFIPDCNRPDVENCTLEEIVNAYDNTLAYTDYVLYQLIEILEEHRSTNDVALLYISDHGESLGENNIFLHAAPYDIAPREQTHVPLQLWLPSSYASTLGVDRACLRERAAKGSFSHDNFFHTVLSLMQVSTPEYVSDLDILATCPMSRDGRLAMHAKAAPFAGAGSEHSADSTALKRASPGQDSATKDKAPVFNTAELNPASENLRGTPMS